MKKKSLFLTLLLTASMHVFAQQDALFSQYMFNMMLVNPAYTGSRDVISVNTMYRKQWVNVPGAPETMTFSADAPLRKETMGIGMTVFNDKIGIVNNTGFYLNYSYRIRMSNNSTLALGVNAGMTNFRADLTSVKLNDEVSAPADAAFSSNVNKILPNVGFGLFYSTDRFYAGISMPHVLNNKLVGDGGLSSQQYRHSFLMAGYVFDLNNNLKLKPSTLIKQVTGAPIQMDLNANLWLYDKFAVGLSYRSLDAPVLLLEAQITDQLRFGYAFDYSLTIKPQNGFGRSSHEFMLRYEFGYDKGKVLTPRYF